MRPSVLILHAPGTNRDRELAWAFRRAGAEPRIATVQSVAAGTVRLSDFGILALPGGFSYGDDLGAGRVWALDLRHRFGDAIRAFDAVGKPILGICNGFQALVRSGLLGVEDGVPSVTLTRNRQARFECRWVRLAAPASPCLWTADLQGTVRCPVAHGEGRIVATDAAALERLMARGRVALTYADPTAGRATAWPDNPNGSSLAIAGLTNARGNILGLMPHPEDHIDPLQHPGFHRGERDGSGLPLFEAGVRHAVGVA